MAAALILILFALIALIVLNIACSDDKTVAYRLLV